jgi:4'-phosphopantetheinyl transferase
MSSEQQYRFASAATGLTCHLGHRRIPKLKLEFLIEVGTQEIAGSGLRIWSANLESLPPAELLELEALLDSTECARAARFHFERDRLHYVCSHGLLRFLLGAALDQSAAAITFEYGVRGKPKLATANNRNLHFNLSHSSGWAMFVLAWDREVGIDLECAARLEREDASLADLAARILSARELEIWLALPEAAQRRAAFLRAWTRKEAYVKATGQGVFAELDRIEVALDAAAPKSLLVLRPANAQGSIREWTLHDLPAPDGFAAALAIEQK